MADEGELAPQVDRKEVLTELFNEAEAGQDVSRETKGADRTRDEQGKFAAKDENAGKEPKAAKIEAAPVTEQPVITEEPPVWERAPASWKKDKHALWAAMSPEQKEYAYQREEQMRSGVEPLLPKAQLADAISKVAEPYMNTIRGMNIDLPTAVKGLMEADHNLRTLPPQQKIQYFAGLARAYGIDLNATAGTQQGQGPVDPNFYAVQNELNSVRGEIASFKQQQEQRENQSMLGDINKFAQKAEYFEEVRPTMIQLLQSGVAETLDDAYEKAIRLDSQIFDTVQARKQAELTTASITAKNAAAKTAKAAAVSIKGSTPGTRTTTKAQDRRSVIAEQFDNLSERF